ncbi:flagellar biosynthetic protein FliO [Simiduia agarivorans]|nr:flagellar biosynthetic protein FliO [Simiduia agarivorans]
MALQLIQVVGALALIVGLIFALAWLARKKQGFLNRGMMNVVERLSLGQKENLVLVRVNGELLLLGVTAGSISLLKTVDVNAPENISADPGFALQLAKVLGN